MALLGEVTLEGVVGSSLPEPLPPGEYRLEVVDVKLSESKAGNEKWELQTVVTAPQPYIGRKLPGFICTLVITPESLWRVKDAALSCGITGSIVKAEDFLGKQLLVRIDDNVFEGKVTNKVTAFYHAKNAPKSLAL